MKIPRPRDERTGATRAMFGDTPLRIAFVTLGSLGDLHPCLALGVELSRRGHAVRIVTTGFYREKVEQLGLEFRAMRPDWDPTDPELIAPCEDLRNGPEILFRRLILPHLRDTYMDLSSAVDDVDVMLAGELVYAAPLVAEKLGLRWASLILSPCSFFSAHDPSVLVNAPWMMHLRRAGWLPYRAALDTARLATRHWWSPVRALRKELGLRRECDPLMKDKFSPELVLALFSSWLACPQPDWPRQTQQTGFLFQHCALQIPEIMRDLSGFLESGDPPVVFTLGSTAVHYPGSFYPVSIEAARRLRLRAVLVGASRETTWITPKILSVPYAPYSEVFPRASVIVHQGGSGTTAEALRAGRPMLVVPWGWDQSDNGARVARGGAGLCIAKKQYSVDSAVSALQRLLNEPGFTRHAAAAAAQVAHEDGLGAAIDAIETMLAARQAHAGELPGLMLRNENETIGM